MSEEVGLDKVEKTEEQEIESLKEELLKSHEPEKVEEPEEVVEEDKSEDISEEEVIELSDIEKEAMEMGWNPKGEKSAEEWVKYAPVYKEKQAYKKRLDKLEKMIDVMNRQAKAQQDLGYKKALEDLEKAKLEAVSQGDVERYQEVDDKINIQKQVELNEKLAEEFKYKFEDAFEDVKLKRQILGIDAELQEKKLDIKEHYRLLEEETKKLLEDQLHTEVKRLPVVTSNVKKPTKAPKKITKYDLHGEFRNMAEYLEKNPSNGISVDDFIQSLIDNGEI